MKTIKLLFVTVILAKVGFAQRIPEDVKFNNPDRKIEMFLPGNNQCYVMQDNSELRKNWYYAIVDTHLHFQPFGGPAIPFNKVVEFMENNQVLFANAYGIGQRLQIDSDCTYYQSDDGKCNKTPVNPSIINDFSNGLNVANLKYHEKKKSPLITLSMTFPDLNDPEPIVDRIKLLDKEFPDYSSGTQINPSMFKWMGEVNLVKQAVFPNGHEVTSLESISKWDNFMKLLRERNIPFAMHADLGKDGAIQDQRYYEKLILEVFNRYPHNKIIWMHMGLSRELAKMDAYNHIYLMKNFLDAFQNLYLDISWTVLEEEYFSKPEIRAMYLEFFNDPKYNTRILTGTDYVAALEKLGNPDRSYAKDLEVTSRILQYLSPEAFRRIALGQNYFDLLGMPYKAPSICERNTTFTPDEQEMSETPNSEIASVRVSPNPASKEVEIQWSLLQGKSVTRLNLYSSSGQLLQSYTEFNPPHQKTIPVETLASGFYHVVLTYNDGTRSNLKIYKN